MNPTVPVVIPPNAGPPYPQGRKVHSGTLAIAKPAQPPELSSFSSSPDPDPTWPLIDGYVVREKLGAHGMGEVYRAFDEHLKREIALKIPRRLTDGDRALFLQEARALAQVDHPNVVRIHSLGLDVEPPYFTMDLIEGPHFATLLKRFRESHPHRMSADRLVELLGLNFSRLSADIRVMLKHRRPYFRLVALWMAQAAEGLQAALDRQVLHRDVKPSNLMLAPDGRVVVVDFGLARSLRDMPSPPLSGIGGTYEYIAPERAMGDWGRVDHRADIWSLGATLYEMLAFEPAYRSTSRLRESVLQDIASKEFRFPRKKNADVPAHLEAVCLRAMARDPDHRYQSWRDFAHDLRQSAAKSLGSRRMILPACVLILLGGLLAIAANDFDSSMVPAEHVGKSPAVVTIDSRIKEQEPPDSPVNSRQVPGHSPLGIIAADLSKSSSRKPVILVAFNSNWNASDELPIKCGGDGEHEFRAKLRLAGVEIEETAFRTEAWTAPDALGEAKKLEASHVALVTVTARPGKRNTLSDGESFHPWTLTMDVRLIRVTDGEMIESFSCVEQASVATLPDSKWRWENTFEANASEAGYKSRGRASSEFVPFEGPGEFPGGAEKPRALARKAAEKLISSLRMLNRIAQQKTPSDSQP